MRKTKKMMALALAASMMMCSSFTALAEDPATPLGSGNTTAEGIVEGHVDKEILKVVLPTVAAGSSAFSYTMDPERLIQGTDQAKYADGTTFPAKESDTGVYFLTADKTYANTSNPYQVINKSSCNITLTVKAKASKNTDNDIPLATSDTVSTTTPELYLGLSVGDGTATPTVLKAEEQTIEKTIPGRSANFTVGVKTNADGTKSYTYKEKADATKWDSVKIQMTGKVSNKDITSETTAPTVDVTWSWDKAADDATAATDVVEVTVTPPAVTLTAAGKITVSGLTADQNFVSAAINGTDISTDVEWDSDNYNSESGGTLIMQLGSTWLEWLDGESVTVEIGLSDSSSITSAAVTLAK